MEFNINYDDYSDLCILQVSGAYKRPINTHELLRIAGSSAIQQGYSRFLFDLREASISGTTLDAYDSVIDHDNCGFSQFFRLAVVYQSISENDKFIENVGVNRGAAAFRVFDDFDEAWGWMKMNNRQNKKDEND